MHRNWSWFDGDSKRLDRDRRARRFVRISRATVYRTHITGSARLGDDDAVEQMHSTRAASDVRWRGRRGGILGPAQHSRGIAHNAKLCVRYSSPPLAGFRSISSGCPRGVVPGDPPSAFLPPRAARRHRSVARRSAAFSARDGGPVARGHGAAGAPNPFRRRDAPRSLAPRRARCLHLRPRVSEIVAPCLHQRASPFEQVRARIRPFDATHRMCKRRFGHLAWRPGTLSAPIPER